MSFTGKISYSVIYAHLLQKSSQICAFAVRNTYNQFFLRFRYCFFPQQVFQDFAFSFCQRNLRTDVRHFHPQVGGSSIFGTDLSAYPANQRVKPAYPRYLHLLLRRLIFRDQYLSGNKHLLPELKAAKTSSSLLS